MQVTTSLWNVRQASEITGLSVSTLYAWVNRRRIPYVKIGGRVLFDPADIREWIDGSKVQPVNGDDREIPVK